MTDERKQQTESRKAVLAFKTYTAAPPNIDEDNEYMTNLGQEFSLTAVIVIYVNGEPVGEEVPSSVQWTFGGVGSYVNSYQPTVMSAEVDFNVNLEANPVALYYATLPTDGSVAINCVAIAPDGTPCQEDGTLEVQVNTYAMVGVQQGEIQLQTPAEGITLLSFGDSLNAGVPGLALALRNSVSVYPGWFGAIQLVNSVRQFTGQSGRIYSLCNTAGKFVLDAEATAEDYIYSSVQVAGGQIADYDFDDTPNQQLLTEIEGDPITQFTVSETFQLYPVFNGSTTPTPNSDPEQIWCPAINSIVWGWEATVTLNSQMQWEIISQTVMNLAPGPFGLPEWEGTIRGVSLRTRPRRIVKK